MVLHKISIGKLTLLDDMSIKIIDILNDEHYPRLYYPLDHTIRNKGLLTLCSPHYVKPLSRLLVNARKLITMVNRNDNTIIPNKYCVKRELISEFDGEFETQLV